MVLSLIFILLGNLSIHIPFKADKFKLGSKTLMFVYVSDSDVYIGSCRGGFRGFLLLLKKYPS